MSVDPIPMSGTIKSDSTLPHKTQIAGNQNSRTKSSYYCKFTNEFIMFFTEFTYSKINQWAFSKKSLHVPNNFKSISCFIYINVHRKTQHSFLFDYTISCSRSRWKRRLQKRSKKETTQLVLVDVIKQNRNTYTQKLGNTFLLWNMRLVSSIFINISWMPKKYQRSTSIPET